MRKTEKTYGEAIQKEYGYDDWHVYAGVNVRKNIYDSLSYFVSMGPSAYAAEHMAGQDYETYCKKQQEQQEYAEQALSLLEYSLEHDIPVSGSQDARIGGKDQMFSSIESTMSIVTLFLIVAAGMSVAREHSDGTIRMLLIRPRKRSKILLSKYLALLTYGYGILFAAFLVQALIFSLRSPLELLNGSVFIFFGQVLEIPALLLLLLKALLLSVMAWLLMSIAFLFSVLTKRSALSILLPMLIVAVKSAVSSISLILIEAYSGHPIIEVLRYSVLPYLDFSPLLASPLDSFTGGGYGIFFEDTASMTVGLCFPAGLAQIVFFGGLFTFLAFRIFRRQEIKS